MMSTHSNTLVSEYLATTSVDSLPVHGFGPSYLARCILPTFSTEVIKHFYEQVCIGCDSGGIQRTVGQLAGYPQCEAGVMSGRS